MLEFCGSFKIRLLTTAAKEDWPEQLHILMAENENDFNENIEFSLLFQPVM